MQVPDSSEQLVERIDELERVARQLEETSSERRNLTSRVVEAAHGILDELAGRRAWSTEGGARAELLELGIPNQPASLEVALDLFCREIDGPGL